MGGGGSFLKEGPGSDFKISFSRGEEFFNTLKGFKMGFRFFRVKKPFLNFALQEAAFKGEPNFYPRGIVGVSSLFYKG